MHFTFAIGQKAYSDRKQIRRYQRDIQNLSIEEKITTKR